MYRSIVILYNWEPKITPLRFWNVVTEDDLFVSFLDKIDFFQSLSRIWIETHFPKETHLVNFLPSHRLIYLLMCLCHEQQEEK